MLCNVCDMKGREELKGGVAVMWEVNERLGRSVVVVVVAVVIVHVMAVPVLTVVLLQCQKS